MPSSAAPSADETRHAAARDSLPSRTKDGHATGGAEDPHRPPPHALPSRLDDEARGASATLPRRLDAALVKLCPGRRRQELRAAIGEGRVSVDGISDGLLPTTTVRPFCRIALDGIIVHERRAYYVLLNKPAGVVSATRDAAAVCAVDILARSGQPTDSSTQAADLVAWRGELCIAGRLDRWTTGLLLLTNDGRFARRVTDGGGSVEKEYRVATRLPIDDLGAAVAAFAGGLYLPDNQRTCRPAKLSQVAGVAGEGADRTYLVTLCEGKRHQVKCMVNAVSGGANRVVALHRSRVGGLVLDEAALPAGAWRLLTEEEVRRLDGAPTAAEERRGGTAAGAA